MYIHQLKIGNVELEHNIILAPMAGVTDLPFRVITKKYGNPSLMYTEMVSSKAIFHDDTKTKKLLEIEKMERPIAIQIFGSDVESMVYAAKYVESLADIIDINMGCPAPKVVKNGDGSKLLLNLDLAENIVKEVVKKVNKPVTVKLRKGWNNSNIVAVDAAKRFEKAGTSAITIHGRTRDEFYSGNCDLEIIKQVKQAVNIPVIGNGDVKDLASAKKMFDVTGVDGIMIGRAALGNPWIFTNVVNGLKEYDKGMPQKGQTLLAHPFNKERLKIMLEHTQLAIKQKGEYVAIREMRKYLSAYTKKLPNSSEFRQKMNQIEDKNELVNFITEYMNSIEHIN